MNNVQLPKETIIIKPKFMKIGKNIINIKQIRNIRYIERFGKLIIEFINSDDSIEINDISILDFIQISKDLTKTYITAK